MAPNLSEAIFPLSVDALLTTFQFGKINFEQILNESVGVIILFYPADFVPIFTEELKNFSAFCDAFQENKFKFYTCSTDSTYTHFAWTLTNFEETEDIKSLGGPMKFNMIGDKNQTLAKLFGLLDEETGFAKHGMVVLDNLANVRFRDVKTDSSLYDPEEILDKINNLTDSTVPLNFHDI